MVIMIDKSQEMKKKFGDNTRMFFGIQAVKAVIDSLNANDNVRTSYIVIGRLLLRRIVRQQR